MTVRTRFAPSPTGYLHIGSARTALYCWLYARKMQGTFILRIEDTDRERSTQESIDAILEGMEWLNLPYEEGPYYQTQHFDRYKEVAEKLLQEGHAYRCYCSKERLEELRAQQTENKEKPRYDGLCRELQEEQNRPFVIRFKNPLEGEVVFHDLVRGTVTFSNDELDDLIIVRSDGTPTYNFTVVVDDADMAVSHVIRGDDHINNTPRQINILKALNVAMPLYAHLPMILGDDGKRLSKRHGAVSVMQYREEGYLAEALLNYLVRLGWSHGDQEIFSREELINYFDINAIHRAPAAFNPEKLLWLNHHYIKNGDRATVESELMWLMQKHGVEIQNGPSLAELIQVQADRCKTLLEMVEKSRFFYEDIIYDDIAAKEHLRSASVSVLEMLMAKLSALSDWEKESLHEQIQQTAAELNLKLGKVAQPIRVAITGNTVSPSVDVTLKLIGKDRSLQRLAAALEIAKKNP